MPGWDAAKTALAVRATTPFRMAASGDSRKEGFGVDTPDKRFIEKLATSMRARWSTAGVTNYATRNFIPINYISSTLVGKGQFTNTVTTSSPNNFGFGTRVSRFRAAGEGTTLTATATTIKLAYTKSNVASSFNVVVDGGAPTLVSWTTTAVTAGQIYTISGLTDTQHVVVISWVSGDVYFEGAHIYRDEATKGVQVFDGGHSGVTSATVLGSSATYFSAAFKTVDPHLIIANPMTNDYGGNVDPAVYKTRMQTYITALKNGCTVMPTIVLVKEWPRTGTFTYTIDQYWAIIDQLVAEDVDQALVAWDYAATMPPITDNTLGYFYTDTVHETEVGQDHRAAEFMNFMIDAIEAPTEPQFYNIDFESDTPGSPPTGWTPRYLNDSTPWGVRANLGKNGGNVLQFFTTTAARYMLSYDALDTDPNRKNIEMLARMRSNSTINQGDLRTFARGSGTSGAELVTVIGNVNITNRIAKIKNAVFTTLKEVTPINITPDAWYLLRARYYEADLFLKIWLDDGSAEPDWGLITSDLDTSVRQNGWAGLTVSVVTGTTQIDEIAFATKGATAAFLAPPPDEPPPVPDDINVGYGNDAIFSQLVNLGYTSGSINDREYQRLLAKVGRSAVGVSLQDLYSLAGERPRL